MLGITVWWAGVESSGTTSWTDPEAPAASPPTAQETTDPERVPPPVALTNVVFAGTVSLRSEERRVGIEGMASGRAEEQDEQEVAELRAAVEEDAEARAA